MKQSRLRLALSIGAVLALLLFVVTMAGFFTDRLAPGLTPPEPAVTGDALVVELRETPFTEPVPATVEARETTIISSRVLARITRILVRAGDLVEENQLLLELEKTDLLARAEQAREQINAVEARLTEARQNLERAEELHRRGLIAVAARDTARANAAALQAELRSARQRLEEAETAVGFTEIRSPIAGRIVDRFAEPGDTASPGQKLLSLYNPFSLRVEAWVREQLALSLRIGDTLKVEIPSLGETLGARIEEIVPAADPGSRSFLVRAILPEDPDLLPGLYARVAVPAGNRSRLLVPSERVAKVGQLDVIWVAAGNTSERRFVRLGESTADGMVEVISGLSPGERILPRPE